MSMNRTHKHDGRTRKTEVQPFNGPVTDETSGRYRQNPVAHGGVCVVETCRCGATRRINVNAGVQELGRWDEPDLL